MANFIKRSAQCQTQACPCQRKKTATRLETELRELALELRLESHQVGLRRAIALLFSDDSEPARLIQVPLRAFAITESDAPAHKGARSSEAIDRHGHVRRTFRQRWIFRSEIVHF